MATKKELELKVEMLEREKEEFQLQIEARDRKIETLEMLLNESENRQMEEVAVNKGVSNYAGILFRTDEKNKITMEGTQRELDELHSREAVLLDRLKVLKKKEEAQGRGGKANKTKSNLAKAYFAERFKHHLNGSTTDKKRRYQAGLTANVETYKKYHKHKNKDAANNGYWSMSPLRVRIGKQP